MGSVNQGYEETVNVPMDGAFAIIRTKRFKESERPQYANVKCGKCLEWWVMACVEPERKKIHCPWCGKCQKLRYE